ncbi:MAG: hypothetical protein KGZ58_01035 [Ignavibacteriales bacterium]|nr:hypothetical protein [Ignavibacteriales bacterium]
MQTTTLNNNEVANIIRQLSPEQKYSVLLSLAEETQERGEQRIMFAERRFRTAAAKKGLQWDVLSEEERIAFVDALVHEARIG